MIHPTAIVSPQARIHPEARIGPWCLIEGEVEIGARTELLRGVTVYGPCVIGADNVIASNCVLGGLPEDGAYQGEPSDLVIGDRNRIYESVVISRGSGRGRRQTRIGHDNLIMAHVHLAHDHWMGNHVRVTTSTIAGGHVVTEDHATVAAICAIGPWVRIGRGAYVTAGTHLIRDVLPYAIAHGTNTVPHLRGANLVGLQRRGFSRADIRLLRSVMALWADHQLSQAEILSRMDSEFPAHPLLDDIRQLVAQGQCGVLR